MFSPRSNKTGLVQISVLLTVLIVPGAGEITGRDLIAGLNFVTPEVLTELTEDIKDATNELGYEANITAPTRLGIGCSLRSSDWKASCTHSLVPRPCLSFSMLHTEK